MKNLARAFLIVAGTMNSVSAALPPLAAVDQAYRVRAENGYLVGAAVGIVSGPRAKDAAAKIYGDVRTARDRFAIGSVSKSFTGILIAQLSIDGKLDLDAPIAAIVPELKGTFAGSVTARQLGTHTSRFERDAEGGHLFDEAALVAYLKAYVPGPPPEKPVPVYSNVGFETLALLIRRTTRLEFREAVRRYLFVPLGMNDSKFMDSESSPRGMLVPHDPLQRPTHYDPMSDLGTATGGIIASLADMNRFLRANAHPETAPGRLRAALLASQRDGIGWDGLPNDSIIHKNGAVTGFGSKLIIDRSRGIGAIVMCDSRCTDSAEGLANVAIGLADDFEPIPRIAVASVDAYFGKYRSADGLSTLDVRMFGKSGFGASLRVPGGTEGYRFMRYDSTRFTTYDGLEKSPDYVEFKTSAGVREAHLFTFHGTLPSNQPDYREDLGPFSVAP